VSQSWAMAKGLEVQSFNEVHVVLARPLKSAPRSSPYQRNFPSSVSGPRHVKRATSAPFLEILIVPDGLVHSTDLPTADLGSNLQRSGFEITPSLTPSSWSQASMAALVMALSSQMGG
jgi:hypothetical protein